MIARARCRLSASCSQEMVSPCAAAWEAKQPQDMSSPRWSAHPSASMNATIMPVVRSEAARTRSPTHQHHPGRELHPGQDQREQVDRAERQELVGGHVHGEASRVQELMVAGQQENAPEVDPYRERNPAVPAPCDDSPHGPPSLRGWEAACPRAPGLRRARSGRA